MSKKRDRSKRNKFGITGRPHSGLSDPDKYGLKYEEVLNLIDSGRWATFYKQWQRGQEDCPRCSLCQHLLRKDKYISILNASLCIKCVKEITDAATRGKANAKAIKGA